MNSELSKCRIHAIKAAAIPAAIELLKPCVAKYTRIFPKAPGYIYINISIS